MDKGSQSARCVHCRTDVVVPASYGHGDHIRCGTCGTQHKVRRGDVLRLVIADVGPLQEALAETERRIESLEAEWRQARASLGIGIYGLGIGLIYLLYQLGMQEVPFSSELVWRAGAIAVVTGAVLELCNYFFLAKRQAMSRLSAEIVTLTAEGRQLQQKIRDATRA
jgi:hypothetical protein